MKGSILLWNRFKLILDSITPARAIFTFYFIAVTVSVITLKITRCASRGRHGITVRYDLYGN